MYTVKTLIRLDLADLSSQGALVILSVLLCSGSYKNLEFHLGHKDIIELI